jgi:bacteriophage N4 adsorption protein B
MADPHLATAKPSAAPDLPEIDPFATPLEVLGIVPKATAVRHSVYPLGVDDAGTVLLASNDLLSPSVVAEIAAAIGRRVEMRLATRADVSFAIRRGYERLGGTTPKNPRIRERVGARLLARRVVTEEQLDEALRRQRLAYARLGDLLVEYGEISPDVLETALEEFLDAGSGRLGDFLVERGYVSAAAVGRALEEQRRRSPKLGELLVALGYVDRFPDDD